jgi:hypothetical protein
VYEDTKNAVGRAKWAVDRLCSAYNGADHALMRELVGDIDHALDVMRHEISDDNELIETLKADLEAASARRKADGELLSSYEARCDHLRATIDRIEADPMFRAEAELAAAYVALDSEDDYTATDVRERNRSALVGAKAAYLKLLDKEHLRVATAKWDDPTPATLAATKPNLPTEESIGAHANPDGSFAWCNPTASNPHREAPPAAYSPCRFCGIEDGCQSPYKLV